MAPMIKGLFKGIRHMSYKFGSKEHEMEIGNPTDVRHVAHIGWDGADTHSPSWMNQFKNARDFSSASLSIPQSRNSSWTSQDFEPKGLQSPSKNVVDGTNPRPEIPKAPRKKIRPKNKVCPKSSTSTSSSSSSSRSARSSARSSKSGAAFAVPLDGQEPMANQIKVN